MRKHTFTRKFLPMALAAAMVLPAAPALAATNDISGHWAEKVLTEWQEKGLLKGYADGSVKPNNSITRAEFITLINNAKGITAEQSISFTDVNPSDWFYSAVAKAAAYTKGYEDNTFRPNQTITRAEAAVMLANVADLSANENGADGFSDAIPAWAKGSVGAVVAAGLMSGYPDGSFGAAAPTTRAEAVSALDRAINGKTDTKAPEPTEETKQPTEEEKNTTDSSSGGSSSKRKNNISLKQEVTDLQVSYATTQADAEKSLPKTVPLLGNDGKEMQAEITWTLQGTWQNQPESGNTCENTFIGTINIPDGYRYNGTMTTRITVTVVAEGVTPETKAITDFEPFPHISISYESTKDAVTAAVREKGVPTEITLNCEDGTCITVPVAADDWEIDLSSYNGNPDKIVSVLFDTVIPLPVGYAYRNSNTIFPWFYVDIQKLETQNFTDALTAAQTLQNMYTTDESTAFRNHKILITTNTRAEDITKDVLFVTDTDGAYQSLCNAIDGATPYHDNPLSLPSQASCDTLTQALQNAAAALSALQTQTGKKYTDAVILQNVNDWIKKNKTDADYAYNPNNQPLKPKSDDGKVYSLPDYATGIQIDADGNTADIPLTWTISDQTHLSVDSNGITVTTTPEEPTNVTFTATAKYNGISLGTVGSYTAIIGAPISLSNAATTPPRIASGFPNSAEIFISLNSADQIESVDTSKITAAGVADTGTSPDITTITTHGIQDYTINKNNNNKLSLIIFVSTGQMGAVLAPINPNGQEPAHAVGYVNVIIPPEALQLKEGSGWYVPKQGLTYTAEIWACNPTLYVNTQMTTDGDKTKRNISVTAKYVGDVAVEVAYTKTTDSPNDNNIWKSVKIESDQATTGSDGEKTYSVKNVDGFGTPGTYHIWCRIANSTWVDTRSSFDVNSPSTGDTE